MRNSASSARWTLSARDCVSERIAAVSPALTAQRSKISQNASIPFASMRSASIFFLRSKNLVSDFRKSAQQIGPQRLQQTIQDQSQQRDRDQWHEHVHRLEGTGGRNQHMAEAIGRRDHLRQ